MPPGDKVHLWGRGKFDKYFLYWYAVFGYKYAVHLHSRGELSMLKQLNDLFVGELVCITNADDDFGGTAEGICKAIHAIQGSSNSFDIELTSRVRFGFTPEVVTPDFVDGPLYAGSGRRKIQFIKKRTLPFPSKEWTETERLELIRGKVGEFVDVIQTNSHRQLDRGLVMAHLEQLQLLTYASTSLLEMNRVNLLAPI